MYTIVSLCVAHAFISVRVSRSLLLRISHVDATCNHLPHKRLLYACIVNGFNVLGRILCADRIGSVVGLRLYCIGIFRRVFLILSIFATLNSCI